jgi:hypothetical protein
MSAKQASLLCSLAKFTQLPPTLSLRSIAIIEIAISEIAIAISNIAIAISNIAVAISDIDTAGIDTIHIDIISHHLCLVVNLDAGAWIAALKDACEIPSSTGVGASSNAVELAPIVISPVCEVIRADFEPPTLQCPLTPLPDADVAVFSAEPHSAPIRQAPRAKPSVSAPRCMRSRHQRYPAGSHWHIELRRTLEPLFYLPPQKTLVSPMQLGVRVSDRYHTNAFHVKIASTQPNDRRPCFLYVCIHNHSPRKKTQSQCFASQIHGNVMAYLHSPVF